MSTASEPLPNMQSVKPSDVLPALAICPTVRAGDCSSTDVEAALCSCHVMPPMKARRRKDEGGKSKKTTTAPSKKLSEATPSRDRNEARMFRCKAIRPLVVYYPSRNRERFGVYCSVFGLAASRRRAIFSLHPPPQPSPTR